MGAFEELLDSWRSNPDSDSTLALCSYLSAAPKEEVVREVGARAEQWHAQDGEVMLAVGRMYLDANLLSEAQSALVNAGKTNPSDARPFRQLGEVLLRRGDAARAEKVLSRALQLGLSDGETRLWHDRAVVYVALQKRVGAQAVAAEVARTLPKRIHDAITARAQPHAPLPVAAGWGEEAPTRRQAAPQHAPPAARPQILQAPQKPKSVPPPLPPTPIASPPLPPPPNMPRGNAISDDDDQTAVHGLPSYAMVGGGTAPLAFPAQAPPPPPVRPPPPQAPLPQFTAPAPVYSPRPPAYVPPTPPPAPVFAPQPAAIPRASLEEGFEARRPIRLGDAPNPSPEAVLDSLARVGVYEPAGGAAPAWETPTLQKGRGGWVLIVGTIVVLGAGGGAYYYAKKVKDDRAEYARKLSEEVDIMIHSGDMSELHASDEKLSKIFELDSRSSRAAKLWLQNRVLTALMIPDEPRGIDSAVHRARQVEVPESEVAFGKIASFLVEGDLAGAASVLPRYDKEAGKDAFYQLTAGAVLERAGDLRAIERYEAAQKLDGKLVLADILLARLALFELGPKKARPVIDALKKKTGETPSTRALEALAWAVDGERPKEMPKSAVLSDEDKRSLMLPLLPVPAIVEAIQAMGGGGGAKVSSSIDSAILLSDTPAMATQLGFLAIKAGDEKLARKAALRALQFSALYPQARVLASRVALLGGRLDEAKKAIEELDPRTPEVVVVRGVVAYESLDSGELGSAVEALGESAKHADYAGLVAGRSVVLGREMPPPDQLETMSQPFIPWGEIVAVDAAMAQGNLELADKLVKAWGEGASRPVFALRVAQLRRYQNKLDEADKYSARALDGTTTARVIAERVYCLVAKEQATPARDLIAKYMSILGPMADWLRMYIDAKTNKAADARSKAAQLDFPSDEAPLLLRLGAARGLAAVKDRRAKNYISTQQRRLKKHPELALAAEDLK
jgi:tetratricopeptide (TPR) repeat protein